MKKSLLLLCVVALLLCGLVAQEKEIRETPHPQAISGQRARPGLKAEVSIKIPYRSPASPEERGTEPGKDDRTVFVWRCDPSTGPGFLYLHEPIWAFIESEKPLPGFPKFVRRFVQGMGPQGQDMIEVELLLSSPEVRSFIRVTVMDSKAEERYLSEQKFRPENATVQPIVINQVALALTGPGGAGIIGTCVEEATANWGDKARVWFLLDSKGLERLKRLADAELVELYPQYAFDAFETGTAERTMSANKCVKLAIENYLKTDDQTVSAEFTQFDRAQIEQLAVANARLELRVSHFQMLEALGTSIGASMLEFCNPKELSAQELQALNPDQARALAQRLVPLLKKVVESNGGDSSTVKLTGSDKSTSQTIQGGFSFGIGPIGISCGGGSRNSDRIVNQFQEASGIHFEKTTENSSYVAQSASIYSLKTNWQKVDITTKETVTVPLWTGTKQLNSSRVPQTFNAVAVKAMAKEVVDSFGFNGVPIGTVLPFFGETVPPGYVWADGKTRFPDHTAIPAHLRNQPVPDMSERILAGIANVGAPAASKDLGASRNAGKLEIPENPFSTDAKLPLSAYSLYDWIKTNTGGFEENASPQGRKIGYVATLDLRENEVKTPAEIPAKIIGKDNTGLVVKNHCILWGFPLDQLVMASRTVALGEVKCTAPAQTVTVPASALPPHVRCNWIIKIR